MHHIEPLKIALVSLNDGGLWTVQNPFYNPLAITTLAGYLTNRLGDQVQIHCFDTQLMTPEGIVDALIAYPPNLLGLSLKTDSLPELRTVMTRIAQAPALSGMATVFGGIAASIIGEDLARIYPGSFVIRGEGEVPLLRLVEVLLGKAKLRDVPNLIHHDEQGKPIETPARTFDLSTEQFQPSDTFTEICVQSGGDFWIESGRGCRAACTFCSREPAHAGNPGHRRFPLERTLARMDSIHRSHGLSRFRFCDEDFINNDFDFVKRFLDGVERLGFPIQFEIDAAIRDIVALKGSESRDVERLELWQRLKKAGLCNIFVGVESLSDTQLQRYRKGIQAGDVKRALQRLEQLDLSWAAGFIPFDPFVTLRELEENFVGLIESGAYRHVNTPIKFLRLQKRTKLAEMAQEAGLITGESENAMEFTYRFQTPNIDRLTGRLVRIADLIKRFGLQLNYLVRPAAEFAQTIPSALLRSLQGQNDKLKRRQVTFLIEAVRNDSEESRLIEAERSFLADCCKLYQAILDESRHLPPSDQRHGLTAISTEFLREFSASK